MLKDLYKIEKVFLALLILFFCVTNFTFAQSSISSDITISATVSGPDTGGGGTGGTITVGTPVATPDPSLGPFSSVQLVTLYSSSSTSIRYTTDGTTPTCSSGSIYGVGIIVSTSETIKAIGCNGSYSSPVATFNYTLNILITVSDPVATPGSGTYTSAQSISLYSASSTSIRYTTDGSTPDCSSGLVYSSSISATSSVTIKAIGCNGMYYSGVSTFNYIIEIPITVGNPVASPVAGTYTGTTTVALTSSSSTSIVYTIDGTNPVCSGGYGTIYSTGIVITSSLTIKAVGCNGVYSSGISTFHYTINSVTTPPVIDPPQASLPSGTYSGSQNVSLSSLNATSIYYTTNGDTPDCSGVHNIYLVEILVNVSQTIKAIGCDGSNFSTVSVFNYIISSVDVIVTGTTTDDNGGSGTIKDTGTTTGTTTISSIIDDTIGTIATTTVQKIKDVVKVVDDGIIKVTHTVKKAEDFTQKVFTNPENITKIQTVTTASVVVGSAVSTISGILFSTFSFADLALLPIRLWALILGLLGLAKRKKPWGTVYDSVTKQPLDPAYVVLRSIEGADVATAITDLDGRYGFVVPNPGSYSIVVNKTNYQFPSQKLVGHDHDELYRDLYFGEHFAISEGGEIIAKNIPMDPEKFDWNEFAKKSQNLMKFYSIREKWLSRISGFFFYIGFIISAFAVLYLSTRGNIIIFLLYVLLYVIRIFGLKSRPYGSVVDLEGKPVSFAIIRISQVETGVEIMHRITDALGRYYCLLPNGSYFVRIDKKLPDATYEKVIEKLKVSVSKGYLSDKIEISPNVIDSNLVTEIRKTDGIITDAEKNKKEIIEDESDKKINLKNKKNK